MPIAHKDDKREVTLILASTRSGLLLPPQVLYAGKTDQVHPRVAFPDGWDVHHTPNHWATSVSTIRYAEKVLLPYINSIRETISKSDA